MKKFFALVLVLVLAAALMAGCGTTTTPSSSPSVSQSAVPSAAPSASDGTSAAPSASAAAPVKTGLAVITSVAKSTDATADKDGLAQADSTIVAVTVGVDGKIVSCIIDGAQTKVNFNASGELTTALDSTFKTKNELGKDYGLGKASPIGKEWNEQAAAFAKYVVGKTADEVKGIAVDAEGKATGSDLTASVTIHVTDFIAGVQKAVANAKEYGAGAADTLGIGTVTNIAKSTNVGDKDGLAQIYSTYTAVTKDAAGKITSCIIDASQANINFDKTGKITSDIKSPVPTKDELGEAYGMKKASSIGKEWNEQAAAFAQYVTGKTAAEVQGIAVSEGLATGADLTSSVTIHITDFQAVIAKATA